MSRQEVEAVAALVHRFERCGDPAAIARVDDPPGKLLRHVVAGVRDEGYVRAIRLQSMAAHPADVGPVRWFAKELRRAVWQTRAQIDIIYGKPRSNVGYWGWRMWRPFDLVLRAVRYGWAWTRHRIRIRKSE